MSHVTDSSTSSEWQSDWNSSSELSDNNYNKAETKELDKPGPSSPASINTNSNSDSDEQSEKCPICLLPFKKQEVGTPSSCEHSFCLDCLMEWSKNINTCPVDRQPFTLIHVKNHIKGKVILASHCVVLFLTNIVLLLTIYFLALHIHLEI